MSIQVKPVSKYVNDVFYGVGWENWVRVQRIFHKDTKHFSLKVVNGAFVPAPVWKEIKGEL